MPPFLSDEWLAALDAAAQSDDGLREAAAETRFVVQQVVTGAGADGTAEVAYYVLLTPDEVGVRPGRAEDPTVTFTQTRATAEAIATGARSAQQAFIDGDLRVGGDLAALAARHRVLARLGDVFAAART